MEPVTRLASTPSDDGAWGLSPAVLDEPEGALWEAKLTRPRTRPGAISRPRLVDTLVSGAEYPLVVISAPVGYGKATLLAEWAETDQRTFVWVNLDPGDGDPVKLLKLVTTAIARVRPVGRTLLADLRSPGVSVLARIVPRLIASIRAPGEPFVLVLRNLHEVRPQESQDAIDLLVDHVPAGVQIVAVSRQSVWLATAGRRSRAEVLELGPEDLSFDEREATQLLETVGVDSTRDEVVRLVQLTEGWGAGLYLSALALRSPRRADARDDLVSPHPFVSEFIRSEVLSQLPRPTARFLVRTSVLDVLTGPLCDAVLDSTGSAARLASISRTSLFLTPIDDRQDWYRVHPLFRAVLLDELVRTKAEIMPELHRRAADWWEANGAAERAIAHLHASGDMDRCARLVAEQIVPAYLTGRLELVEAWLHQVGDPTIEHEPSLALLAGWIAALAGRPIEATRWADAAEHLAEEDDRLQLTSLRAMLDAALCRRGIAAMAADAEVAVGIEPAWSVWRTVAIGVLGVARWLAGDDAAAGLLLDEAIETAEASRASVPLARWLAHRAILLMDREDWAGASSDVTRALTVIGGVGLSEYGASALAYAAAARLRLHEGGVGADRTALDHAMRLRPLATWALPWYAALVRLELADVHLALADAGAAGVLLHELDEILHHRPDLGSLCGRVERLRAQVRHVDANRSLTTLTTAELRVLPYLQTHLSLQEIGERLYVSRNTVNTQVGSIYRKLGVTTRSEAVRVARDVGLLAPSTLV